MIFDNKQELEDWYESNLIEYYTLDESKKDFIKNFTILWSFFEYQVLNTEANPRRIIDTFDVILDRLSDMDKYEAIYMDIKNWYDLIENKDSVIDDLKLRHRESRMIILDALSTSEFNPQKIKALLLLVLRVRNNLFHGLKWMNNLYDFDIVFKSCIKLLMIIIEDHKSSL